jgi:hypothetical protein
MVVPISTSEGWNMVYWASGCSRFSDGSTSWIWMPPMSQPWDSPTPRNSPSVSASVMYTTDSPRLAPSTRNCSPVVVLPVPGSPSIR